MTEASENAAVAPTVIPWRVFAEVALGSTFAFAWIFRLFVGHHESLDHPNATSMSITADRLDYIVSPLPSAVEAILGALGLAVLVHAFIVLRKQRANPISVFGQLVSVVIGASTLGFSWVAITYGTVDANIGGGIALIFGLPFGVVWMALGWLIVYTRRRDAGIDVAEKY